MIEKIDCPCCGSNKNNLSESINYINSDVYSDIGEEIFDNRKLYFCIKCNFSYSTPFLSNEILDNFYTHGFSKRRISDMNIEARREFKFSLPRLQRIFFASSFLNQKENHTMLEFGGGDGSDAQQLQNLFPKSIVNIDDSKIYKDIWKLRGVEYKSLNSYKEKEIDLFYSSHSFEHINAIDQNSLLDLIKKKLSKDAIIYIEVPNDDFSNFQNRDKLNEGCHVSHFTQKSLECLISKYFDIIDISVRGSDRQLSEDLHVDRNKLYSQSFLKRFLKRLLNKLGILKFIQSITIHYHIKFPKNKINQNEELIKTMFFYKNIDEKSGSIISVLARNKF